MKSMVMASSKNNVFKKDGLHVALLHISRNVGADDERGLKFLLRGQLNKIELHKPLRNVFKSLEEKQKITQENIPWIIVDCLQCIGQIGLITTCFGENCLGQKHKKRINHFRRVLYDIGMDLSTEEWQSLSLLFGNNIPKSRQEKFECALDLFLLLEERKIICKENTEALKHNLNIIERPTLSKKLEAVAAHDDQSTSDEDVETAVYSRCGRNEEHPALMDKYSFILKNSVIKGIHVYQRNPPVVKQLSVIHEEDNEYDENACIVTVPDSRRRKCKKVGDKMRIVEDIDVVGHVPWGLSKAMRYALDRDCSVAALKTGKPCPSFPPWPPMFQRGGGLVLPCTYIFNCYDDVRKSNVMMELGKALNQMEPGAAMTIESKM